MVENCIVANVDDQVVGINVDKGDTATIAGLTVVGDAMVCGQYKGTSRVGEGEGNGCNYKESEVKYVPCMGHLCCFVL